MKTATIRDVRHNLSKVLSWVEEGEEVRITRRNQPVAKIVPAGMPPEPVEWPDFSARARRIWGRKRGGKSLSETILEEREDH
jgi:prevent-host-death family protein